MDAALEGTSKRLYFAKTKRSLAQAIEISLIYGEKEAGNVRVKKYNMIVLEPIRDLRFKHKGTPPPFSVVSKSKRT
ncbi:MAG: hypothetical protein ACLQEQ_00610 [Nitrososphaerales archaeon]